MFGLSKPIVYLLVALAAVLALWWLYSAITANPKAEARLGRNQAEAALESGTDAVNTVGQAGDRESNLDKGTEDAGRKIDAAPDAAGADAAGSERLCQLSPDLCRQ